jgi:hypothetical protein
MSKDIIKEGIEALKRIQQGYTAKARLKHYLKAAQARKDTATDDEAGMLSGC